ncbi:MAG: response regulator [Oscillospiraceae bacterium]|nr:response regulator [Oscillospiraceae bacterium]
MALLHRVWCSLISSVMDTWRLLDRSIFVGTRYQKNMRGMGIVSLVIIIVGTIMSVLNIVQRYYQTLIVSLCIVFVGCLMYFFVKARKNREAASFTALVFAVAIFTYVTITGTMNGFAILWTTLIPLIVCYYFNVKYGIFLFLYFEILFCILFYTPLRQLLENYYTTTMMNRYPILYFSLGIITSFFMIQYHKSILDQMDYAEQLQKSKDEAERSNAAKSDFLANMSHEIRTPINAVLGMNEMILRESLQGRDLLASEHADISEMFSYISVCAGNIDSAGNGLLSIINDILDFSKIEAGKLEIVESEYRLSSALNDMTNMIAFRAKDKGLEFRVDVDETLPDSLYGDEVRVRQVITNVLNNAVKYTKEGSVTLSVNRENIIEIKAGDQICLVVSVSDTGIGIKKEDFDKLFGKFERLDLQQNSTVEGTGLGLAISQRLLEMMGGSIKVESIYGRGSVFTIILPQKVVSTEPVGNFREKFEKSILGMQAYKEPFRAPEAHILIVDDTRMNLAVAVGLLKGSEIKIDTATSGPESINLARQNHYDLILMDQRMPEMDGSETLRYIHGQAEGINRETPIICLTADAISGARERYLAEGFTDYLSKPIDSLALARILIKYLPKELVIPAEKTEYEKTSDNVESVFTDNDLLSCQRAGVNTNIGLQYCQNDKELYLSILCEYVKCSGQRLKDLQRCFETSDWKNYAVLVHALKSTSKTIGAVPLSETAAELESAANREYAVIIQSMHDSMMQTYSSLADTLGKILGITGPMSDDEDILEFLPEEE